jgi:hypothetical protein
MVLYMSVPPAFPEVHNPIVDPSHEISDGKSAHKRVCEPGQASHEGHPIPYEELSQKSEMGTNDISALEDEQVGGKKNPQSRDNPGGDALDGRIQAQKPGEYNLFESLFVSCHVRSP